MRMRMPFDPGAVHAKQLRIKAFVLLHINKHLEAFFVGSEFLDVPGI